jgi:hypothetical protein
MALSKHEVNWWSTRFSKDVTANIDHEIDTQLLAGQRKFVKVNALRCNKGFVRGIIDRYTQVGWKIEETDYYLLFE